MAKEEVRIRTTFTLPAALVTELQTHTVKLKGEARAKGDSLPGMSEVVERAIRAELAKHHKRK